MRASYRRRIKRQETRGKRRENGFRHLYFAVLLAPLVMAGCGDGRPSRVPVSGSVTIDGEPLTVGYLRFVPPNDRPSAGTIGSDGRFTLGCFEEGDGAVLGKHQVAVIANKTLDEVTMKWFAPQKYADYTTSGIEIEITGPTDDLLIELSSEESAP